MGRPPPKTPLASSEQVPDRAPPGSQGPQPPTDPPVQRPSSPGLTPLGPAAPPWPQRSVHFAVSPFARETRPRMSQPSPRTNSAPPEEVPRHAQSGLRGSGQLMVPSIPWQDRLSQAAPTAVAARSDLAALALAPGSHQPPERHSAVRANEERSVAYFFPGRERALATRVVPEKSRQGSKAMPREREKASAPLPSPGSTPPARFPWPALPRVPRGQRSDVASLRRSRSSR
jgi:hypothetical protein